GNADLAVGEGVRASGDVHAPARRGAVPASPPGARLGLRLREPLERCRRLHAPAAAEDRRTVRARVAGYGTRPRLPAAQRGVRVSRLPIRLRVAAAFAVAMAAVLAGTGLYLYLHLGSQLTASLDRDLRLRAQDLAALIGQPHVALAKDNSGRFVERGESYVQLLTPEGRVLDATRPLGRRSLLSGAELHHAEREPIYADKPSVPGLNEGSRLLATRVTGRDGPIVLVVGATRENNVETLGNFRDELLIAG